MGIEMENSFSGIMEEGLFLLEDAIISKTKKKGYKIDNWGTTASFLVKSNDLEDELAVYIELTSSQDVNVIFRGSLGGKEKSFSRNDSLDKITNKVVAEISKFFFST